MICNERGNAPGISIQIASPMVTLREGAIVGIDWYCRHQSLGDALTGKGDGFDLERQQAAGRMPNSSG